MEDAPMQVGLLERPDPAVDRLVAEPPMERRRPGLVSVVAAVVLTLLLAAPVAGQIAELMSGAPAEVVTEQTEQSEAFPVAELSQRGALSVFEEVEAQIADAIESAEAAADEARQAAAEAEAKAEASEGSSATSSSRASTSSGSARSSSSSNVDISQSVSGGGSVSSSSSVSNSSSSRASSGGSVVVSESSSSKVSTGGQTADSTSSCVSEVVSSTEIDGVRETSREVSRSC